MNKRELSHDKALAALESLALDALEANEREAVLAHVAWCADCRAVLKRLRAVAAQIAFSAPAAVGVPGNRDRIRARLVARAAADVAVKEPVRRTPSSGQPVVPPILPAHTRRTSRPTAPVRATPVPTAAPVIPSTPVIPAVFGVLGVPEADHQPPTEPISKFSWRRPEFAMAASALLALSLGVLGYSLYDRHNLREALGQQVAFDRATTVRGDSLQGLLASRDSMIASLIGRDVSVMRLTSAGAQAPFALMFWDKATNTWTMSAHNMPALKPGRTYQLWLVTANAKISAGTFDPKNGDAVVRATYPLSAAALVALAVTEEQAGGAAQPTTPPVIAVSAQ